MFADRRMLMIDEQKIDESARRQARIQETRARNRRTGLILATIALAFFVGIFLKYSLLKH